jgi:hypothetical protein
MNNRQKSLLIYIGIIVLAIMIGGHIIEYIMAGLVTLLAFVALVESISTLKWLIARTYKLVDCIIFGVGIYAKFHFGVTIAMAFLFAGLGFTLLYAPYIRDTYDLK